MGGYFEAGRFLGPCNHNGGYPPTCLSREASPLWAALVVTQNRRGGAESMNQIS